jgi:hypothetical protein
VPTPEWARLRPNQTAALRRGAWYRVVRVTSGEAVLDVNGLPIVIARTSVQIVTTVPTRWAVVSRPPNALRMPLSWGSRYGVCPNCRERARLEPRAASMRCPKCNGLFDIGWEEE